MKNRKIQKLLISIGSVFTAGLLALSGASAAQAVVVTQMPEDTAVVITKLKEPAVQGEAATGVQTDVANAEPIQNVSFSAYPVRTQHTAGTIEWQKEVAALDVKTLSPESVGTTAVRSGITNAQGVIRWDQPVTAADANTRMLPRGVYLIRETAVPAGVVPSADFLLTVPLTNPGNRDSWLSTVYVYPKNTVLGGVKTVNNERDYAVGNTVSWTLALDNPSVRSQDADEQGWLPAEKFVIVDSLDESKLEFVDGSVAIALPGTPGTTLLQGTAAEKNNDWYLEEIADVGADSVTRNAVTITFTDAGLEKLAAAKNSVGDKVNITLDTVVKTVGLLENSAQFWTWDAQTAPTEIPETDVRYGQINLVKTSSNPQLKDLSGAEFRVYLSEAAAKSASAANSWGGAYAVNTNESGYLVPSNNVWKQTVVDGNTVTMPGVFQTATDGTVAIGGLRYSNWANGALVSEKLQNGDANPVFQPYWIVETKALAGHQLLGEPIRVVLSTTGDKTALEYPTLSVQNVEGGGFDLPLTGGIGTAILTLSGLAILAIVLIVARRRRAESVSAE